MAAIDLTVLEGESNCFNCFGRANMVQLYRLALLARTLTTLVPMAATDPQSLLSYASCYRCNGRASMVDMMELALLDQISQNIGGGGGGAGGSTGYVGAADPNTNQTGNVGDTYFATGSNTYWVKETGAGTDTGWTQLI